MAVDGWRGLHDRSFFSPRKWDCSLAIMRFVAKTGEFGNPVLVIDSDASIIVQLVRPRSETTRWTPRCSCPAVPTPSRPATAWSAAVIPRITGRQYLFSGRMVSELAVPFCFRICKLLRYFVVIQITMPPLGDWVVQQFVVPADAVLGWPVHWQHDHGVLQQHGVFLCRLQEPECYPHGPRNEIHMSRYVLLTSIFQGINFSPPIRF